MAVQKLEGKVAAVYRRRTDLGDRLPEKEREAVTDTAGHDTFARICVPSAEGPVKVGEMGLDKSSEFHRSLRSQSCIPKGNATERAILVQTAANLADVRAFAQGSTVPKVRDAKTTLEQGSFGENLYIEDVSSATPFSSQTVCIGDQFHVFRAKEEKPVATLQVASPRRPCSKVDKTHGQTYNLDGVRCHTAQTGNAGFFFRVLQPGTIQEGDTVKLMQRPHPAWTIQRVSSLLYGSKTAVQNYLRRGLQRSEWMGTDHELEELANIEELAVCEYREELFNILGRDPVGKYSKRCKEINRASYWGGVDGGCAQAFGFILEVVLFMLFGAIITFAVVYSFYRINSADARTTEL